MNKFLKSHSKLIIIIVLLVGFLAISNIMFSIEVQRPTTTDGGGSTGQNGSYKPYVVVSNPVPNQKLEYYDTAVGLSCYKYKIPVDVLAHDKDGDLRGFEIQFKITGEQGLLDVEYTLQGWTTVSHSFGGVIYDATKTYWVEVETEGGKDGKFIWKGDVWDSLNNRQPVDERTLEIRFTMDSQEDEQIESEEEIDEGQEDTTTYTSENPDWWEDYQPDRGNYESVIPSFEFIILIIPMVLLICKRKLNVRKKTSKS